MPCLSPILQDMQHTAMFTSHGVLWAGAIVSGNELSSLSESSQDTCLFSCKQKENLHCTVQLRSLLVVHHCTLLQGNMLQTTSSGQGRQSHAWAFTLAYKLYIPNVLSQGLRQLTAVRPRHSSDEVKHCSLGVWSTALAGSSDKPACHLACSTSSCQACGPDLKAEAEAPLTHPYGLSLLSWNPSVPL